MHCIIVAVFTGLYVVEAQVSRGSWRSGVLAHQIYPVAHRIQRSFRDMKFRLRGPRVPQEKVVVVDIDSLALDQVGRWPWRRDYTAYLIQKTFEAGAKVVGVDMIFSEPQEGIPEELRGRLFALDRGDWVKEFDFDAQLAALMQAARDRLVVGWGSEARCRPAYHTTESCPVTNPRAIASLPTQLPKFAYDEYQLHPKFDPTLTPIISVPTVLSNIPLLNAVLSHTGFVNALRDTDGIVRNTSLVMMANGVPYPSFALKVATLARGETLSLNIGADSRVEHLAWKKSGALTRSPTGMYAVNYYGEEGAFPYVSALDILSDSEVLEDPVSGKLTGRTKKSVMEGAVALIGTSALANYDRIPTPFDTYIPGVEVHATIVDNLLSGSGLRTSFDGSFWVFLLLLVGGGGAYSILLQKLEGYRLMVLTFGLFSLMVVVDGRLFQMNWDFPSGYLYLEYLSILATALAAKYVREEQRRQFLRRAFSKYVSPTVVEALLENPDELTLGGRRKEMTVLFCDIRGFTTFAEKMDPQELSQFLNDYLSTMSQVIFQFGGTLDKFIGDAIMAFWGAPLDQPDHATRACQAALGMVNALDRHHERFLKEYGVDVRIGIGISTGAMTVGNLGSEDSFDYTVVGDEVNLGARLEGATKMYRVPILASETTFMSSQKSVSGMAIGRVQVKGKAKSVTLFSILGAPPKQEAEQAFQEGIRHFTNRKWDKAIRAFESAKKQLHYPGICDTYIERCALCIEREPGADWDGSWHLDSK